MRPTHGIHIAALDHLRAFAALLVIAWHVAHTSVHCAGICSGSQLPQTWPWLAWIEQGHTGVSLFLVLSGYVFAHLTEGKELRVLPFWRNRLLRLMPLLAFWMIVNGLGDAWRHGSFSLSAFLDDPAGAWTVFLELRYYLLLPLLLWLGRRLGPYWAVFAILGLIGWRYEIWRHHGSVQYAAYWTLVGRLDQFLLGGLFFALQRRFPSATRWRWAGGLALLTLWACYGAFARGGGAWPGNNSPSAWWVILPTLDGLAYGALIVAYASLPLRGRLGDAFGALGRWSYSLYLNHFAVIGLLLPFAARWIPFPEGLLSRLAYAGVLLMPPVVVLSALSYRWIECPWLGLRRPYLRPVAPVAAGPRRDAAMVATG